mgnify:FL=1
MAGIESFFSTQYGQNFTLLSTLVIAAVGLLTGFVISGTYMITHRRRGYMSSFVLTLVILPTVISIIILLVGNNFARAFSLAGAFSLVRYRSDPTDPKDLAYVFFGLASGLAAGIGYIGYAMLFTVLLCLILVILEKVHFGERRFTYFNLKILVPENLNYEGAFDDILRKYTTSFEQTKVRTTDFGTMYEVCYRITMASSVSRKELIDSIRVRNGNMNVVLTVRSGERVIASD